MVAMQAAVMAPAVADPGLSTGWRPSGRDASVTGRHGRLGTRRILLAGTVLAGALAGITLTLEHPLGARLLAGTASTGDALLRLRWQYAAIVLVLAGLHYLSTAVAARAASGLPLPLGETMLVQFAAAAANRLTPAGLGGSAVTARYLSRRGLDLPGAVGAVATIRLAAPLANLLVLLFLVRLGGWFGLRGGSGEFAVLTAKLGRFVGIARSPWIWLAILLAAGAALAIGAVRRSRGSWPGLDVWQPLRRLVRCPSTLFSLVLACGATTLIMAFAFTASLSAVPGPQPHVELGALLIAFMLGSAAGTALPIPAGLGSTEAALTAVLIGFGVPMGQAVQQVVIFRLLTFWLPAAGGLLAVRHLRRQAAL